MGIAILAILVLGFIVLAYLAAKTWQVWHVLLLAGIFVFGLGFMFLTAASLKVHSKFRIDYEKQKRNLEQEQARHDELKYGNRSSGEDAIPALRTLQGDLRRLLADRGRVWRNLRRGELGQDANGNNTVTVAAPWANAGTINKEKTEGPDNTLIPHVAGLTAGPVVFAFRETPIGSINQELRSLLLDGKSLSTGGEVTEDEEGNQQTSTPLKLPTAYLGEFKITAVNPDEKTITMTPTLEPDEQQLQLIGDDTATWVIYEQMPIDSHDAFRGLTAEQLRILFPRESFNVPDAVYEQLIAEYEHDGEVAAAADEPERKWTKVKFTEGYVVDVDVQTPVPDPTQPFDSTGRAQAAAFQQGEQTKFQAGDEALLDSATAQRLSSEGKVELMESIFVRQLRDYEQAFRLFAVNQENLCTRCCSRRKRSGHVANFHEQTERTNRLSNRRKRETHQRQRRLPVRAFGDYRISAEAG